MRFRRNSQRYGATPAPVTPYQRAAQVWDDRLGAARSQVLSWKRLAFGALGLSVILAGGLIWQSAQSRVTPYVVEVDRLGEPKAVAVATSAYLPTDPQIAWHLARFITNVRSIAADPVVVRANWLEAYDVVGPSAAQVLNDFAQSRDPFGAIGVQNTTVQVTSVVRASPASFQVKWLETRFERGQRLGDERWTALVSVKVKTPTTVDALRKNPLGLKIETLAWSPELEPTSTKQGQR